MRDKLTNYLHYIKSQQDSDGFIDSKHCDSLLFTGLVGAVGGLHVDLMKAYDPQTKQWHRRPAKNCFPNHSKSTISRDMLLGALWYAWRQNRLDISESIVKKALSNWMVIGEAVDLKVKFGRCVITPGLLATAAWVSYKLGGPSRPWLRWMPSGISSKSTGFKAHLAVLHGLLRDELTGRPTHADVFKAQATRQIWNPLFQYAAGNYEDAKELLMREEWWPADRLPTSKDRKESWLIQRDYGIDWHPQTGEVHTHSGADFIFVASLLLDKEG